MILRSYFLGACIALSMTAAAEASEDTQQVMLVCQWDDSGGSETLQIFGPGRHLLPGAATGTEIFESHNEERIYQHSWVLDGDTLVRINMGTEDAPEFVNWSYTINRYTGRMKYFDSSTGVRTGSCKKVKEKLF